MNEAFKKKITAEDICKFLLRLAKPEKLNASSNMKANIKDIPDNVIDQIFLWEVCFFP